MQTVEEAMTVDVPTVRPDEPVTVAARIMRNAGTTVLLVVDASGHLAGILTKADLPNRAVAELSEIDDRHGSRNRSWTSAATDLISRSVPDASRVKSSVTSEANTAYPGLVPRFAYFANDIAKRREGSREQTASPIGAGNNNDDRRA